MIKYLISVFALLVFAIASTSAAPKSGTVAGKIVAIDGTRIQVSFEGEKPAWVRKGAIVKVANEAGEAVDNIARVTEIADDNFTINTRRAADLKVGDVLSFERGRATTGC